MSGIDEKIVAFAAPTIGLMARHSGEITLNNVMKMPRTILTAKDIAQSQEALLKHKKRNHVESIFRECDCETEEDRFARELGESISLSANFTPNNALSHVVLDQVIEKSDISVKTNGERYTCIVYDNGFCDLLASHMIDRVCLQTAENGEVMLILDCELLPLIGSSRKLLVVIDVITPYDQSSHQHCPRWSTREKLECLSQILWDGTCKHCHQVRNAKNGDGTRCLCVDTTGVGSCDYGLHLLHPRFQRVVVKRVFNMHELLPQHWQVFRDHDNVLYSHRVLHSYLDEQQTRFYHSCVPRHWMKQSVKEFLKVSEQQGGHFYDGLILERSAKSSSGPVKEDFCFKFKRGYMATLDVLVFHNDLMYPQTVDRWDTTGCFIRAYLVKKDTNSTTNEVEGAKRQSPLDHLIECELPVYILFSSLFDYFSKKAPVDQDGSVIFECMYDHANWPSDAFEFYSYRDREKSPCWRVIRERHDKSVPNSQDHEMKLRLSTVGESMESVLATMKTQMLWKEMQLKETNHSQSTDGNQIHAKQKTNKKKQKANKNQAVRFQDLCWNQGVASSHCENNSELLPVSNTLAVHLQNLSLVPKGSGIHVLPSTRQNITHSNTGDKSSKQHHKNQTKHNKKKQSQSSKTQQQKPKQSSPTLLIPAFSSLPNLVRYEQAVHRLLYSCYAFHPLPSVEQGVHTTRSKPVENRKVVHIIAPNRLTAEKKDVILSSFPHQPCDILSYDRPDGSNGNWTVLHSLSGDCATSESAGWQRAGIVFLHSLGDFLLQDSYEELHQFVDDVSARFVDDGGQLIVFTSMLSNSNSANNEHQLQYELRKNGESAKYRGKNQQILIPNVTLGMNPVAPVAHALMSVPPVDLDRFGSTRSWIGHRVVGFVGGNYYHIAGVKKLLSSQLSGETNVISVESAHQQHDFINVVIDRATHEQFQDNEERAESRKGELLVLDGSQHFDGLTCKRMFPLAMMSHLLPVEHLAADQALHPIDVLTADEAALLPLKYCWIFEKPAAVVTELDVQPTLNRTTNGCAAAEALNPVSGLQADKLSNFLIGNEDVALSIFSYFDIKSHFKLARVCKSLLRYYLIGLDKAILFPYESIVPGSMRSIVTMLPHLQGMGDLDLYDVRGATVSAVRSLNSSKYKAWLQSAPCLSGCCLCRCQSQMLDDDSGRTHHCVCACCFAKHCGDYVTKGEGNNNDLFSDYDYEDQDEEESNSVWYSQADPPRTQWKWQPNLWHGLLLHDPQDDISLLKPFFHKHIKPSFVSLFIWKSLCLAKANWLPVSISQSEDKVMDGDWLAILCPELFSKEVWSSASGLSRLKEIRDDVDEVLLQPLLAFQYLLPGSRKLSYEYEGQEFRRRCIIKEVNLIDGEGDRHFLIVASKKLLNLCEYHDSWRERWRVLRTTNLFKVGHNEISDCDSADEQTNESPYITSHF